MKQMIITLLFVIVTMTAAAQEQKGNEVNEKYFNAKVSELIYRLDISEEQKEKFVPIYRRYSEEMRNLMGSRVKHKSGERKKLTDEEKLARTRKRMERQQQAQTIRIKYLDELSNVLNAQQVNKFFEVENKIQKKLMDRRKHPKNLKRKHGKGFAKNKNNKNE